MKWILTFCSLCNAYECILEILVSKMDVDAETKIKMMTITTTGTATKLKITFDSNTYPFKLKIF